MERRMGGRTLAWGAALVLPALLVLLFETRKWDRALMDRWVSGVMAPVEQQLGRFWGRIPWCSAAELLTFEVTVALPFAAWPGDLVKLDRAGWKGNGLYRVRESKVSLGEKGYETTLLLGDPKAVL